VEPKPVPSTGASENRPGWVLPEALEYLAQGGAANLVTEIMDDFRTDVAARLLRLRQAVARNDGPGIKIEAHSIKGSSAQMGASDLAAACLKLEIDAGADKESLAGPQVEAIQALFDQVCLAIGRHPLGGK
jgi:HPt (histidine-containing phosphotransfer) domain-containing protein